jgi:hypothetical protein
MNDPAVAHEQTALRYGDDVAERGDAVLQRHAAIMRTAPAAAQPLRRWGRLASAATLDNDPPRERPMM